MTSYVRSVLDSIPALKDEQRAALEILTPAIVDVLAARFRRGKLADEVIITRALTQLQETEKWLIEQECLQPKEWAPNPLDSQGGELAAALGRARPPTSRSGFVYVIGPTDAGPVKIGASGNPSIRLRSLQSASPVPLALLAQFATEDMFREERRLHAEFADVRMAGEWFERSPGLMALIHEAGG